MASKLMRNIFKEEPFGNRYATKPPLENHAHIALAAAQQGSEEAKGQPSHDLQQSFDIPCTDEDAAVFASLLRRCSAFKTLRHGKRVHSLIVTSGHMGDTFFCNLLIQMYSSCGALAEATSVFAHMPKTNVFSWNLLIGAYIQNQQNIHVVLPLYRHMQQKGVVPDQVTFVSTLSAFSAPRDLLEGQWMHVCMHSSGLAYDPIAGTALLNMYGKCSAPNTALKVFDRIVDKNVISWNAMFAVYTQHGQEKEALKLFQCMEMQGIIPNNVTFITLLPACTCQGDLANGKQMHTRILHDAFESNVNLDNALLDMYGKCGAVELACSVFAAMPERDVISWNVMAEAYIQKGQNDEAFYLFKQMKEEGTLPDDVSCVSILSACVNGAALCEGKRIHSKLIYGEDEPDVIAGTALVNMYAKCGNLEGAQQAFDDMPSKNVISWNSMIGACAQHGLMSPCLYILHQMLSKSVVPTDSTYFSVLSACSHSGFVEEGYYWFLIMVYHHRLTPTVEHFNCMIDLLGRAGQLNEAEVMLYDMSCQPSAASWAALLGGCSLHADIERGVRIIDQVIRTNPENAAPFVVLSNLYASLGEWGKAGKLQRERKGARNQPDIVIDYDFWEGEYLVQNY